MSALSAIAATLAAGAWTFVPAPGPEPTIEPWMYDEGGGFWVKVPRGHYIAYCGLACDDTHEQCARACGGHRANYTNHITVDDLQELARTLVLEPSSDTAWDEQAGERPPWQPGDDPCPDPASGPNPGHSADGLVQYAGAIFWLDGRGADTSPYDHEVTGVRCGSNDGDFSLWRAALDGSPWQRVQSYADQHSAPALELLPGTSTALLWHGRMESIDLVTGDRTPMQSTLGASQATITYDRAEDGWHHVLRSHRDELCLDRVDAALTVHEEVECHAVPDNVGGYKVAWYRVPGLASHAWMGWTPGGHVGYLVDGEWYVDLGAADMPDPGVAHTYSQAQMVAAGDDEPEPPIDPPSTEPHRWACLGVESDDATGLALICQRVIEAIDASHHVPAPESVLVYVVAGADGFLVYRPVDSLDALTPVGDIVDVQAMLDAAQPGDVVTLPDSGALPHPAITVGVPGITVQGESRDGTVLEGVVNGKATIHVRAEDVTVRNLTLSMRPEDCGAARAGVRMEQGKARGLTVEGVTFRVTQVPLLTGKNPGRVVFRNNLVLQTGCDGRTDAHGVYINHGTDGGEHGALIEGNVIRGIGLKRGQQAELVKCRIQRCVVRNNDLGGAGPDSPSFASKGLSFPQGCVECIAEDNVVRITDPRSVAQLIAVSQETRDRDGARKCDAPHGDCSTGAPPREEFEGVVRIENNDFISAVTRYTHCAPIIARGPATRVELVGNAFRCANAWDDDAFPRTDADWSMRAGDVVSRVTQANNVVQANIEAQQ